MRTDSRLSIIVLDNQATPLHRATLTDAFGLRITTVLPGGCGACSFKVAGPIRTVPYWAGYGYEVRVLDGGNVLWSGRIEDMSPVLNRDGAYWEITAIGWGIGLDDQVYTEKDIKGLATDVVVSNVITDLTPASGLGKIDVRTISTTSFTFDAVTAINLKLIYARQVLAYMMKFGDSGNNQQQWHVYPQDNSDLEFTWEDRPTAIGLMLWLDDMDEFAGGVHGARLANQVVVRYNGGASFVTVNDTALQGVGPGGWGFIRTAVYTAPELPLVAGDVDATQLANAILTGAKALRLAATHLQLKPGARLLDGNGGSIPPWRVRAGKLCQIADMGAFSQSSSGGAVTLDWNNSFLIVGTSWDDDEQTLTITPESQDLTLDQVIGQAVQLFRGRHMMNGSAA